MSSAALGVVSCLFGPRLWSPQESFVDRYSKSFEMNFARANTHTQTHTHPDNVSEHVLGDGWAGLGFRCYRNCFAMEFSIRQQGAFCVESAKKKHQKKKNRAERKKLPYRVS